MKKSILFLLSIIGFLVTAQDLYYKKYKYDINSITKNPTKNYNDESVVVLKEHKSVQYLVEEDGVFEVIHIHRVIKANTDKGVEQINTSGITLGMNTELLFNYASIYKDGKKISEVKKSDIIEEKNEENGSIKYSYALESVEIGSVLDYAFVYKRPSDAENDRFYFQDDEPKYDISYHLAAPIHLEYLFKVYNYNTPITKDTVNDEYVVYKVHIDSLAPLYEEPFSAYAPNLVHVINKLYENYATGKKNIVNFKNISNNVYNIYFTQEDKKLDKKLNSLIKKIGIKPNQSVAEKIIDIERYIKLNFNIIDVSNSDLSNIDFVLKNKVANERGIVRLYTGLFRLLDIETQLILTGSSERNRIDPDFETYIGLTDFIFYFPQTKEYMMPTNFSFRYGNIPSIFQNTYGLFISGFEISEGVKAGIGETKIIKQIPYVRNSDTIRVDMEINGEFDHVIAKTQRVMKSSTNFFFQANWHLMTEERKKDFDEYLIKFISKNAEVLTMEVLNYQPMDMPSKPFIINTTQKIIDIIEVVEDDYLLNIGLAIGRQQELYQERPRQTDISGDANKVYQRILTVKIPDGYEVGNLNSLDMDVRQDYNGNTVSLFTSKASINGDVLTIIVDEYYKELNLPISEYEEFREVINAAADFNKKVVIFKKKA